MLDEKKIEEAKEEIFENEFELYSNDIEYSDGNIHRMFTSDQLKQAISFGAHWAIQEFLKGLWHDASEEPKCKDKGILIRHEVLDNMAIGDYHIDYDSFILGDAFENQDDWEEFKDTGYDCVESWLCIDDLLPKQKGGEK